MVTKAGQNEWLFGAPEGIAEHLKEAGIEMPDVVLLTALRSPGLGWMGKPMLVRKEQPLRMDGCAAIPLTRKHGVDYSIEDGTSKVLFSERGDVSVEDVSGYDLAVIRNKHRADAFGPNVITWPWPDAEYSVEEGKVELLSQFKIWSKMDDVPDNLKKLKGAPLTLAQANWIAKLAKKTGADGKENWAIAIHAFEMGHVKEGDAWVEKPKAEEKAKEVVEGAVGEQDVAVLVDAAPEIPLTSDPVALVVAEKSVEQLKKTFEAALNEQFPHREEVGATGHGRLYLYDIDYENRLVFFDTNNGSKAVHYNLPDSGIPVYDPEDEWLPAYQVWEVATMQLKEAIKNKAGLTADDFLIAEDPEMPSTWHLPVVKEHGKPDLGMMGAASAAITVGYRGKKYEGPDKEKAVKKLVALYKKMEADIPENLAKAAGIKIAEKEDEAGSLPIVLKSLVPGVPAKVDSNWSTVYKEGDQWRWASITSVSMWDRQKEYFSPEAMDWAIRLSRVVGAGPLRYKHIPGLDGGDCDRQARVGDFLFESGTFRDGSVGLAMRTKLEDEPGAWQISPGLAYSAGDLVGGRYRRAAIFERSMTKVPAIPATAILSGSEVTMKQLTDDELKEVAKELQLDEGFVKQLHSQALQNASTPFGLKEFKEIAEKEASTQAITMLKEAFEGLDDENKQAVMAVLQGQTTKEEAVVEEEEVAETTEAIGSADVEQLKEMVQASAKAISDLATVVKEIVTKDAKEDENLPRRQAAKFFATKETPAPESNESVLGKLNQVQKAVEQSINPLGHNGPMYQMFTSRALNRFAAPDNR
jgi:hypothetical protein